MNFSTQFSSLSQWGLEKHPFFALINFDGELCGAVLGSGLKQGRIDLPLGRVQYSLGAAGLGGTAKSPLKIISAPDKAQVMRSIREIQAELADGLSYLVNYCSQTIVEVDEPLASIFERSTAPYTVWYEGQFMSFSPEAFISVRGSQISTTPMKGTGFDPIALMTDSKEQAEHATVVDLLRNDLGKVASAIEIQEYRYLTTIPQMKGQNLYQTSSRITGVMPDDWRETMGDWLPQILPAGSITGAPKAKTVDLIRQYETEPRGFFTGIAVHFDGENLTSCVLIRYLDLARPQLKFRSGAGITVYSDPEQEYQEILDKVYLPV